MSVMNEISIEIQELLVSGIAPEVIADKLSVPLTWVFATQELLFDQEITDFDPFNTINS